MLNEISCGKKHNSKPSIKEILSINNKLVTDPQVISDNINKHFNEIGKKKDDPLNFVKKTKSNSIYLRHLCR